MGTIRLDERAIRGLAADSDVVHELKEVALRAAEEARTIAPVLTGAYRASIRGEIREGRAVVTATDRKALWLERGTGEPGPTRAYRPLERGTEMAGLRVRTTGRGIRV